MPVFENFPYTNFHDLNLDYILKAVKDYCAKVDILEINFTDLKNYVINYFDNLDLQEEVDNKLDEMAGDGTLAAIIAQYLSTEGLLCFDTIADLKAAANLIDGVDALCIGDALYNDGKPTLYKIRALQVSDVVDEVNILSLTNYPSSVAELLRVDIAVVDVKYYGAAGDGVTNDLDAIKAARDAAIAKGLPLYFPAGTYLIGKDADAGYLDSGLVIEQPLTIFGDGYSSLIKASQTDPTPIQAVVIANTSNVIIRDIAIDGSVDPDSPDWSSGYGVHGIRLESATDVVIDHVKITNCLAYGIGAQKGIFKNITINNCYIDFCGQDCIDFKNLNNLNEGIKILNTICKNPGMNDLLPNQNAQCCIDVRAEQSVVSGCQCLDIPDTRSGIRLRLTDTSDKGIGGRYSTVSDCIVKGASGNTGYGIVCDDGSVAITNCSIQRMGIGILVSANFQIISNTIFDKCTKGIQLGAYGVFVSNCLFTSTTDTAVRCQNNQACFFTNCLFSGAATYMFDLAGSNKIYITQSFARGTIGQQFNGTTTNVHITQCENIST